MPSLRWFSLSRTYYGRHAGARWFPVVICLRLDPSAPIVNRPELRAKINLEPSGDHAGWKPVVNSLTSVPFGVINAIVTFSSRGTVMKAILLPSGLQAGLSSVSLLVVSRLNPVPSLLMTQISRSPYDIVH